MTAQMGAADQARVRRAGVAALTEERGLTLFDAALAGEHAAVLALDLDRPALRARAAAGTLPPIFAELVRVPTRRGPATGPSLASRLAAAPAEQREALALAAVRAEIATVLGHTSPEAIEPARTFKDLGFDSLAAVELRNRLSTATGWRLAPTMVFDHPSAEDLARQLVSKVEPGGDERATSASREHDSRDAQIDSMDVDELIRESIDSGPRVAVEAGSERRG